MLWKSIKLKKSSGGMQFLMSENGLRSSRSLYGTDDVGISVAVSVFSEKGNLISILHLQDNLFMQNAN